MKSQEEILLKISDLEVRKKEIAKKIKSEVVDLPDYHATGRVHNLVRELTEINFKIEVLKSIII
jgi:hypothetical protein